MIDNNNTYLKIEDYLNEKLSEKETISFENEMSNNPALVELVENYRLTNEIIIQAELSSLKNKLGEIHQKSLLRKKVIGLLIGLVVATIVAISIFFIYQEKTTSIQSTAKVEKSVVTDFITSDPTPLTIIDSMDEVKLSKSIQSGKIEEAYTPMVDSIIHENNPIVNAPVRDSVVEPKKIDSTEPVTQNEPVKPSIDSTKSKPACNLELNLSQVIITNSCIEKGTGSIQFTTLNQDLQYSIDSRNFSSQPKFNYLHSGFYNLSIRNPKTECISETLEIEIEGYQCNYAIEPDRFVYFEKSMDKFQDQSTVEVFIFNKNGVIVYSKTHLTTEKFIWKGTAGNNQPLPLGNYTYLIKGGTKISKGEVTVIR